MRSHARRSTNLWSSPEIERRALNNSPGDLVDLDDVDGTASTASFKGRILSRVRIRPVVLECQRGRGEGDQDDGDNGDDGTLVAGRQVLSEASDYHRATGNGERKRVRNV